MAIIFEDVSRSYRIKKKTGCLIKDTLFPGYYTKEALKDVSFTVGDSEIVGYIGPNGAGKSTSMKIMTGILRPTSGKVEILGMNPYLSREKYVRKIGAVFGNRSNYLGSSCNGFLLSSEEDIQYSGRNIQEKLF